MAPPRDYAEDTDKLKTFLQNFQEDDHEGKPQQKYQDLLQKVSNREERVVEIDLDDVRDFLGVEMADAVRTNTRRYISLISDAIDQVAPPAEVHGTQRHDDVLDVLLNMRQQQADNQDGTPNSDPQNQIPPSLKRRYEVRILPESKEKPVALREIKAPHIGQLVTVRGIVTRITEVKPQIQVATYTSDSCGFEIYQEVSGRTFMPLQRCPVTNGNLRLQTRGCKFTKFQEVKIQEEADQVPIGHIPRTLTIHLFGELTRSCSAGDTLTVSGIFLPVPYTGFKALRAGLITDVYLEAMHVEQHKKTYTDFTPTPEIAAKIREYGKDANIYDILAQSIAPEIFGHLDVKKALLMLMVGGATREMKDGMKIRGDINVCLMGDPGVAKSQLLKHVSKIAPRAIYTTGKGSSGVGLTAAVVRDTVTNELVLEGGALVLADMGICCIDEFDKMEETDRTAIHEVMEQQTVSIAKAGITTTLNARTAILAAANPLYSRYNLKKSPEENINLPAALLSRFDLLWLILDKADLENDKRLAEHVAYVHRYSTHPPNNDFEALEPAFIRAYVAEARKYEPFVSEELSEYIVDEYVNMRQDSLDSQTNFGFTSARSLLAVLRLSQGLARLRFSDAVTQGDVDEARRLMYMSRSSLMDAMQRTEGDKTDAVSAIYNIIRDHAQDNDLVAVKMSDVMGKLLSKGHTKQFIDATLDEYVRVNVWQLNPTRTIVRFVEDPVGPTPA